jgi:glycosyltransferase involved in cell wall biosynthesis
MGGVPRILMVIHTPWTQNLGGPRVQLELAAELRELGHEVEKFSYDDAFPRAASVRRAGRLGTLAGYLRTNLSFAERAEAYVRANAGRFDIIDANQTDLPLSKRRLGFGGLLVARSVGLIPAYERFERFAAERWPEPRSLRREVHRALTWPGRRRRRRDVEQSFRAADLINVSNPDDLATVRDEMGYGDKVVMFPFGMSAARREAFCRRQAGVSARLATTSVAFIGNWNSRKGAKDWPSIVAGVRRRTPGARFLFLGTGLSRERVLDDFPAEVQPALEVVPSYDSEDLPDLLATATVGAFPGYLEGFGFAVLEKLAAGLPTVVYDAPGPRDLVRGQAAPELVPPGDVEAFAERVSALLALTPESYGERSRDAVRAAARFDWREIARATREVYLERWESLAAP